MPHVGRNDLTAEFLRRQVSYDPETGIFVRKFIEGRCHRKNRLAGMATGTINSNGYLRITIDKVSYKAHRLAWLYHYGEWPKNTVDHINGIRTDNRIINLRDVPHAINQLNLKRHRAGFAPYPERPRKERKKGCIFFLARTNRWMVQFKREYLGCYVSREMAERRLSERLAALSS